MHAPGNAEIATAFDRIATLLEAQHANPHRVRAYRTGATTCRELSSTLQEVAGAGGRAALEALPGIGPSLSAQILEYQGSGRIAMLERLLGETPAEDLFTTLPGMGPVLAHRIHEQLGADTLEELEVAAHDGRLARVPGIGPRRAEALRDALSVRLSEASRRRAARPRGAEARDAGSRVAEPPISALLAVDALYRERAAAGSLRRIAPRRFNPEHRAWLPILHSERDGWAFTALFSNTARAHQLGRTHDWVVVFAERDGEEQRFTVVTEHAGPLAGKRVVRGRERECALRPGEAGSD